MGESIQDRTMTKHNVVLLFYKYFVWETPLFHELKDSFTDKLHQHQVDLCSRLNLRGRVLLSIEGVNGTVSAHDSNTLDAYISAMEEFDFVREFGTLEHSGSGFGCYANLYSNIDWKKSVVDPGTPEPFPDLKITVVDEIVSTGGSINVNEIAHYGGRHLTPREFHDAIQRNENVVLIDVRNTFECSIGHFVNPHTGKPAINPQMVTFSSFDATFCSRKANELKGKKVLMYCTGGIRCEKASAMLKKRGVQDVSQLKGGIHRYMETFGPEEGFFKGKNFVFDQRVALAPTSGFDYNSVVGTCIECGNPFDELSGSRLCTVCRDLVLVCPSCQTKLKEYHCERHARWKECYYTFIESFSERDLRIQVEALTALRDTMTPASEYKNMRRTLSRQIQKVQDRINRIAQGNFEPETNIQRRCRTCMEANDICDGNCFGFWKHRQVEDTTEMHVEPRLSIAVGNRVAPGPHWNVLRLGDKVNSSGRIKVGTVVEIKSWASEGDENDCVAVVWDGERKYMPEIYRWGFIARNHQRMYDVQII